MLLFESEVFEFAYQLHEYVYNSDLQHNVYPTA